MLIVDFMSTNTKDDEGDDDEIGKFPSQPPPSQTTDFKTKKGVGFGKSRRKQGREEKGDGENVMNDKE